MTFSTPQAQDSPTFPAQALTDATDLAAVQAAGAGSVASGVVSGCAVTPHSSGVDLNVNVASGTVIVAGATVAVSAATNVTVAAASTHDRRDIVTVNSSGVVSTTAGTACSVAGWTTSSGVLGPVKPAIPASSVLLAEVYVPGAATSITASNIVAKAAPIGTSVAHAVRCYNSANISIANATITALTFDTNRWDTDSFHSTVTNTSRLTMPLAGWYHVWADVQWATAASGMGEVDLRVNGVDYIAAAKFVLGVSASAYQQSSTIYKFAAGDYVEAVVQQSSGGALNVTAATKYSPEFAAVFLGS